MTEPMYQAPVMFRTRWDIDPRDEDKEYYNNYWFQPMLSVRTRCYICKKDSPVVQAPWGETVAFGDPHLSKRHGKKLKDMTADLVRAFAQVGWKYQYRRAYCPTCKGLGRV